MRKSYLIFIAILILFSLPMMVVIIMIIVISPGVPVFFRQKRTGLLGKSFILIKFRTMQADTGKNRKDLMELNEADGPVFKIRNDPRFTSVGRFLSHTGLDELSQLFNSGFYLFLVQLRLNMRN